MVYAPWSDLDDFVQGELEHPLKLRRMYLGAVALQGLEPLVRVMFAEEAEGRSRVDEYARGRACSRLTGPMADPVDEWWYRLRVECLADTLDLVRSTPLGRRRLLPSPPRLWRESELLEWGLLPLWHRRYDHWIKLEAVKMVTGLPFYGVEPSPP